MATPKNKAPIGGMGTTVVTNLNGSMGIASAGYGYTSPVQPTSPQHTLNQFTDPNNTTVFVGGLSGVTHEDELRGVFAPYGDITYVKIPPGKGCGFVQFVHRQSAEMAINQLNGYQIGNDDFALLDRSFAWQPWNYPLITTIVDCHTNRQLSNPIVLGSCTERAQTIVSTCTIDDGFSQLPVRTFCIRL